MKLFVSDSSRLQEELLFEWQIHLALRGEMQWMVGVAMCSVSENKMFFLLIPGCVSFIFHLLTLIQVANGLACLINSAGLF